MTRDNRQAVMYVDRQKLEHLLPDWPTVARLRYDVVEEGYPQHTLAGMSAKQVAPFHTALKLPRNCIITGISAWARFDYDQIAFRLSCPDFKTTDYMQPLTEVQAVYANVCGVTSPGYFSHFCGDAVEVLRFYGPDGSELRYGEPTCSKTDESVTDLERIHDPDALPLPPKRAQHAPVLDGFPVVFHDPNNPVAACWRCQQATGRRLNDGTPECGYCAGKNLL